MKKLFGIFVAAGLCGGAAQAETAPRALKADERIRTVAFEKDNVVFLAGTMGVSTMIVFDDEETIATVAMGDSLSWQAVPDQSKHYLFIKPLERDAVTNMNVVTTKRIYNFVLRAGRPGGPGAVYKLRFVYPDKEEDARLHVARGRSPGQRGHALLSDALPEGRAHGFGIRVRQGAFAQHERA